MYDMLIRNGSLTASCSIIDLTNFHDESNLIMSYVTITLEKMFVITLNFYEKTLKDNLKVNANFERIPFSIVYFVTSFCTL